MSCWAGKIQVWENPSLCLTLHAKQYQGRLQVFLRCCSGQAQQGWRQSLTPRLITEFKISQLSSRHRHHLNGLPLVGCCFRFCYAILRKLQDIGLISFYCGNLDYPESIQMLYSLCYVPAEKMVEYCKTVVIAKLCRWYDQDLVFLCVWRGRQQGEWGQAIAWQWEEAESSSSFWLDDILSLLSIWIGPG